MKVMIGDGKIRRVWEVVRGLGGDEVRRFVEYGWRSDGVWEAMRVSERVADGLLRVLWYYDVLCGREGGDGDEGASVWAEDGSQMSSLRYEHLPKVAREGSEALTRSLHV